MLDFLFATAFTAWGAATTWLEVAGFVLSLLMVGCNIRGIHWGWPLAMASSALYGLLFAHSKLYGDAGLQVFFIVVAFWGWRLWLRADPDSSTPDNAADNAAQAHLQVHHLSRKSAMQLIAACAVLWPVTGFFLLKFTDTDVPWWDAFPTALSIIGQFLLGRKIIENWLVWIAVNVVSIGLYAYKGLWLTVLLYALFVALSLLGWRAWKRMLTRPASQATGAHGPQAAHTKPL